MAVAAAVVVGASGDDGGGSGPAEEPQGGGLFETELSTLDGASVRLARYVGQPLVVNFFASWCGPCVREMPDFEAVHARRGDEVRFVGVNLQDAPDAAASLVQQTGVTYDVVRDERGALFRAVNGFSMPTTVFVDADGEIVDVHGGELTQRALEERIDRLLDR
jgi:cytochrome c biogenesis protein CcmG/thiol:disulfide interchange protein DsbE